MLKKYSILLLIIIPLIITIFISCNKKEDKMIIITPKNQYTGITYNEEATITIPLYIENNKNFYLDKKEINKAYLKTNKEIYEVEIEEITKGSDVLKYENKELSSHNLKVKFKNCTKEEIRLINAYLELTFKNSETIKIEIGSVLFKQVEVSTDLSMINYKAIVNDVMPKESSYLPTTVGVLVKIKNNSNNLITITNLFIINSVVKTNLDNVKVISSTDYLSNVDINELIDTNYELVSEGKTQSLNIDINPQEEISLVVPFSYLKLETVNEAGLIIEYLEEETKKEGMVDSIPLFNSTLILPSYDIYAFTPSSN